VVPTSKKVQLDELLVYALGGQVPEAFVSRLVRSRHLWDDEFRRRLEELAFEFRPDLAVWEITTDEDGELVERPLVETEPNCWTSGS
jgi:hypothetical protein